MPLVLVRLHDLGDVGPGARVGVHGESFALRLEETFLDDEGIARLHDVGQLDLGLHLLAAASVRTTYTRPVEPRSVTPPASDNA